MENEQLLDKIEKFYEISKVDLDKHLFLKENAEIVLAENEGLKEKINNLRNQNTIIHEDLSKKIREMKKDVITARNQVDDMKYVSSDHLVFILAFQCSAAKEHNRSFVLLQTFQPMLCGGHWLKFLQVDKLSIMLLLTGAPKRQKES